MLQVMILANNSRNRRKWLSRYFSHCTLFPTRSFLGIPFVWVISFLHQRVSSILLMCFLWCHFRPCLPCNFVRSTIIVSTSISFSTCIYANTEEYLFRSLLQTLSQMRSLHLHCKQLRCPHRMRPQRKTRIAGFRSLFLIMLSSSYIASHSSHYLFFQPGTHLASSFLMWDFPFQRYLIYKVHMN